MRAFGSLFLLLPLLGLSQNSFAQTVVDPVQGNWTVTARNCSSGVPANDSFRIGIDEAKVSFLEGKYDGLTKIDECNYWVSGKYETQGHMLRIFDVVSASNCGAHPAPTSATFFYAVEDGHLKLYFSIPEYNQTCPHGDMLEVEYTQAN